MDRVQLMDREVARFIAEFIREELYYLDIQKDGNDLIGNVTEGLILAAIDFWNTRTR